MKTGFDFGALRTAPKMYQTIFIVDMRTREVNPFLSRASYWTDTFFQGVSLKQGEVFLEKEQCDAYCKYMNKPPSGQDS